MEQELQASSEKTQFANVAEMLFTPASMAAVERFSIMMAKGTVALPKHLQGKPADCMAICMQAMTWGMNPFLVAQKTHVINGALGYEAQLVNSVIVSQAPTKDRLHFEWFGPWKAFLKNTADKKAELDCGVRVWATMKGENSPRELLLEMNQATVRNSPLWKSDPKQQLAYLAIKKWARLYCPDAILGVYTTDEVQEITEKDITPAVTLNDLLPDKPKEPDFDTLIKEVLKSIDDAGTTADIERIGDDIRDMDVLIKDAVRDAYISRRDQIKGETVDTETGEVKAEDPPAPFDPDQLVRIIEGCQNIESLAEATDLAETMDKRTVAYSSMVDLIAAKMDELSM